MRRDIRSSFGSSTTTAQGVPLTINLALVDSASGCGALPGAAVYLWHCNREGQYSMYSAGVEDENYLRGVQVSDAGGRVSFQSVFPAAYSGRWPHIHFEVFESVETATSGGTPYSTSQLAMPEEACREVYATDGYEQSVSNLAQTSLERDNVFSDDDAASQLAVASGGPAAGYDVELTVPVDTTVTSTGGAGGGPGGPGPP